MRFEFVHHRFNAFFEVAAIACASQQRTHVEREDGRTAENFRYCALDNTPRQAFGNGSFADTRVADIEWIVFRAPTQYLNRALNFVLAPDQRVDVAALSFSIEIDAVGIKCFTTRLTSDSPINSSSTPETSPPSRPCPGTLAIRWEI